MQGERCASLTCLYISVKTHSWIETSNFQQAITVDANVTSSLMTLLLKVPSFSQVHEAIGKGQDSVWLFSNPSFKSILQQPMWFWGSVIIQDPKPYWRWFTQSHGGAGHTLVGSYILSLQYGVLLTSTHTPLAPCSAARLNTPDYTLKKDPGPPLPVSP